jgi:pyruvate-formate lyase-activating enzyme
MSFNKMKTENPQLVVSDGCGNAFEIPGIEAVGMNLRQAVRPGPEEWTPLPDGSRLMELPARIPVGYDPRAKRIVTVPGYKGNPVIASAAFIAPGHAQIYLAGYETVTAAPRLPLFAYAPVGWKEGRFWVPCFRADADARHDPSRFDPAAVDRAAGEMLKLHPENRLVEHLVQRCVREYGCPNAQNFVLGRWECPVPVSPGCNADCLGCISEQKRSGVRSTQDRIGFTPSVHEITGYAIPHLKAAERAMISFGQGCEGEPLLKSGLIEKTVRVIRGETGRGTIHINSNAGDPDAVDRVFRAGMDSIRVSLNSARPEYYQKYFRLKRYGFEDVLESLGRARKAKAWISLNYFIFPGFTDGLEETEALVEIVREFKVDMIQMRNLNIDPEWYIDALGLDPVPLRPMGILKWRKTVKRKAPWIRFGCFNPPKEEWGRK